MRVIFEQMKKILEMAGEALTMSLRPSIISPLKLCRNILKRLIFGVNILKATILQQRGLS